jgi:5-methylcytosine-specific restriction endonuclease McrA
MSYERNKLHMYRRDGYHCRFCKTTHNLTPHHIIFRSQGGSDELDNLLTLCINCHTAVHDGHLLLTAVWEDGLLVDVSFKRANVWRP